MATPTIPIADRTDWTPTPRSERVVDVRMKTSKQQKLLKRFRPDELAPKGRAQNLDKGTITIRTAAFIQIGLILTALVVVIAMASYALGYYTSSFLGSSSPHPQAPPELPAPTAAGAPVDQNVDEAFRDKVDRLQIQLTELRTRQSELEIQLQSKTLEADQYALATAQLRTELVAKEREIDNLSETSMQAAVTGRQFSRGSTEYKPAHETTGEPRGFALDDGTEIKVATAMPEFPAEIIIELAPPNADPGEPYQLSVRIHNHGNRSIDLDGLEIVWNVSGRFTGGSIPIASKNVSPRTTLLLHEVGGTWIEDLNSAQIVATVTLAEGGRLSNTLSWTDS